MSISKNIPAMRYQRQELFGPIGPTGQTKLAKSKVLIVGAGGLGSWLSELLIRAGVGEVKLADADTVDWTNLARQAMYEELDAADARPKFQAAEKRLHKINSAVTVHTIQTRLAPTNINTLADGVDLILDGTDDWTTRFVINDYAVKMRKPWIFAGVVGAQGQVMPYLPGRGACLRCVFETPPSKQVELANKASALGVLGPAVAAIASIEAIEAMKILTGQVDAVGKHLLKINTWTGQMQKLDTSKPTPQCPCCQQGRFDFLPDPER
jgi:adenylyltransferase/sulfurtransferase